MSRSELLLNYSPSSEALWVVSQYSQVPPLSLSITQLSENALKQLDVKDPKFPMFLPVSDASNPSSNPVYNPVDIAKRIAQMSPVAGALLSGGGGDSSIVDKWMEFAASRGFLIETEDDSKTLDAHLVSRTFIGGNCVSVADLVIYTSVRAHIINIVTGGKYDNMDKYNLIRWFNHIQNLSGVATPSNSLVTVNLPPPPNFTSVMGSITNKNKKKLNPEVDNDDKENKSKTKEKEKKEKPVEQKKPATDERPILDVTRLEVRVGVITKVWCHPDAEKLYCEEIDIGEAKPRQIASGLRPYLNESQMMGARVLVLCNLKPRSLKGFVSHGMVLCASDTDGKICEFIHPPTGTPLGELVRWPSLEGVHDEVLNPKKDAWGKIQPLFATSDQKVACFMDIPFTTSCGVCFCDNAKNGTIS
eukprot:GHVR01035913.1.p1 GENE.GHVR01035913.1~~GHVR01035913.1.p1  ORF type:complete len:417 (-),score=89.68 GHVR01035913.1:94-1344(-)